jgi:hypothetical protein
VFDPLALTLVLAANGSRVWDKEEPKVEEKPEEEEPKYEPDNGPLTEEQIEQVKETVEEPVIDEYAYLKKPWKGFTSGSTVGLVSKPEEKIEKQPEEIPCFKCGTTLMNAPGIGLFCPNLKCDVRDGPFEEESVESVIETPVVEITDIITHGVTKEKPFREIDEDYVLTSDGKHIRKEALKEMRPDLFIIKADDANQISTNFGTQFPKYSNKGDVFVRVDMLPNKVYKFDGNKWIEINKELSDSYLYDQAYIQFLISKIDSGEYEVDLLSDNEKAQIASYLSSSK